MKKLPIVVWLLLAFLALRVLLDLRSLVSAHSLAAGGPLGSRNYGLYIAIIPLVLFRVGTVALSGFLIWRRRGAGLVIAAMLFAAELYGTVLRDFTTGVLAIYGGDDVNDNVVRAVGHYSMLLIPLFLLVACATTPRSREFFGSLPDKQVS